MRRSAIFVGGAVVLSAGSALADPPPPEPKGWLTLSCTPRCDDVREGGSSLGPIPPAMHRQPLDAGEHRLELRYGAFSRPLTLTIRAGEEVRRSVEWPADVVGAVERRERDAELSPPAQYRNKPMMIGGVVLTITGTALLASGLGMGLGTHDDDSALPFVGFFVLAPLSAAFVGAGIPLWALGARDPLPPGSTAARGPAFSWSLAPLALSPLPSTSRAAHAGPPPAGLSLVGTW